MTMTMKTMRLAPMITRGEDDVGGDDDDGMMVVFISRIGQPLVAHQHVNVAGGLHEDRCL